MKSEFLYHFMEVAYEKNISRAAKNLGISQQNISRNIQKLEEELGVVLFERKRNGVFLTTAGEETLRFAEKITDRVNLIKEYSEINSLGFITLGYSSPLLQKFIAELMRKLIHNNGLSKIKINEAPNEALLKDLLEDKLDMGIIIQYNDAYNQTIPEISEDLLFLPLTIAEPVVWINKTNKQKNKHMNYDDLKNYQLLDIEKYSEEFRKLLSQEQKENYRFLRCDNIYFAKILLENSTGVILDLKIKHNCMFDFLKDVALPIPLNGGSSVNVGIVLKKEQKNNIKPITDYLIKCYY